MFAPDDFPRNRPVCLARPLLARAYRAAEKGFSVEGACLLREALRRYLAAVCEFIEGPASSEKFGTPAAMIQHLADVGHFVRGDHKFAAEIAQMGRLAAFGHHVPPERVMFGVGVVAFWVDQAAGEIECPRREGVPA